MFFIVCFSFFVEGLPHKKGVCMSKKSGGMSKKMGDVREKRGGVKKSSPPFFLAFWDVIGN